MQGSLPGLELGLVGEIELALVPPFLQPLWFCIRLSLALDAAPLAYQLRGI
jgi:hypothetical protein